MRSDDRKAFDEAERKADRVMLWMRITAVVAWTVFFVALTGEIAGWWETAGEVAITAASIIGVVVTLGVGLYGAGRGQLRSVGRSVEQNGRELRRANGTLASMDGKLDGLDKLDKLDTMDGKLDRIGVRLEALDVIQLEIDAQTGVMDEQLTVLRAIRDRLPRG